MLPSAYIVHQTRERVRLKIPERRKDADYFDRLSRLLEGVTEDIEFRVNETLGTVLIIHPDVTFAELYPELDQLEAFDIVAERVPSTYALTPLISSVKTIDRAIANATSGGVDLRSLLFVGAILAAIRQVRRGDYFSPAAPLLWSAMDMVTRIAQETPASSSDPAADHDGD